MWEALKYGIAAHFAKGTAIRHFFPLMLRTHHTFTGHQAFVALFRNVDSERRHTFRNCGTLARKITHFHDLRHACEKRCCTCEKDSTLARKATQFWDCDELGTIAARPSKCGAHGWEKSAARYTAFIFLTHTVHQKFDNLCLQYTIQ